MSRKITLSRYTDPAISTNDDPEYWNGVVDVPANSWLFDLDNFEKDTPSRNIKLTFQDEVFKRVKGVTYIFNCCKQLRLSRSVGLTASTIFHRFYMIADMKKYHYYEIGATSLFIACKSEECRRNLKDFVKICAKIAMGKSEPIDEESKIYWTWKDLIVKLEEIILANLNFDVTPENPYTFTMNALGMNTNFATASSNNNNPNDDWVKSTTELFGNCTYLFELFSRLPICLFCTTNSICALIVILSSKKFEITFPIGFMEKAFNTDIEQVLTCYNDIISLATEVEILDKYFRILPYIPRTTESEIESLFKGTQNSRLVKE